MGDCNLDRGSIKNAIQEEIQKRLTDSELINNTDDGLVRILPEKYTPMTTSQQEQVNSALEFKDDITDKKTLEAFSANPEEMMRSVAKQAYSNAVENGGILSRVGARIFEASVKTFPNDLIAREGLDLVNNINTDFKSDVLKELSPGVYKLDVPDQLVTNYLMEQPGSQDLLMDELRKKYLDQFASGSLNLLSDDLWLSHPILQTPSIQGVLNFARKLNPGFRVGIVDGLDQAAVSIIRDHIIMVGSGAMIDSLPEEVGHFFVGLLPNDSELRKSLMSAVLDSPIYGETLSKYKDDPAYQKEGGGTDYEKIKAEAAGKLLGDYVKAAYEGKADEKYGGKRSALRDLIDRIFKFLRRAFSKLRGATYREPIATEANMEDPFASATKSILSGDTSNLDLTKVLSNYDSIFFSKVEDVMPESFEASDVTKSIYSFAKAMRNEVNRAFFDKINTAGMKGLKDLLDDPKYKSYSRVFDISNIIKDGELILKGIIDHTGEGDVEQIRQSELSLIAQAAERLAESYKELEIIPQAMSSVVRNMKEDGTLPSMLDNMKELQTYFNFTDTLKKISTDFGGLLSYIRSKYKDPGLSQTNSIYEIMLDKMGSTDKQIQALDIDITKSLSKHVENVMVEWTKTNFNKYSEDLKKIYGEAEHENTKKKILQLLREKIVDPEQIKMAIQGRFPQFEKLLYPDGTKMDISRVKDMHIIDYGTFMLTSPSLVKDPFVSNLVKYFSDHYMEGVIRGTREAIEFAGKVIPYKIDLAKAGVGWYDAEDAIQGVQDFYDRTLPDKKTQKRVLLSETHRSQFMFDKVSQEEAIDDIRKKIQDLQAERIAGKDTTSDIEATRTLLDKAKTDLDDFLKKNAFLPMTDEYYQIQQSIKPSVDDSKVFKQLKELDKRIQDLNNQQYVITAMDGTINETLYEEITSEMAKLQNQREDLATKLPERDKEAFDKIGSLYEMDKIQTERIQAAHKRKWTSSLVRSKIQANPSLPIDAVSKQIDNMYDNLFNVVSPKQEMWDKRAAIMEQVSALTADNKDLTNLTENLKELEAKRKKILQNYRNIRGEVSVISFRYTPETAETLKNTLEDIESLRSKIRVYSILLNSGMVSDQQRNVLKGYVDVMSALVRIANNPSITSEGVKNALSHIASVSDSDAEAVKSAFNKSRVGDHSELQQLGSYGLKFKDDYLKTAYSTVKFDNIASIVKQSDDMLAGFAQFAKGDKVRSEELSHLFDQLNALATNTITYDYAIVMREFFDYFREYLNDTEFGNSLKPTHQSKYDNFRAEDVFFSVKGVEDFLGDGLFESVIDYLENKPIGSTLTNVEGSLPVDDYIRYITAIHRIKTVNNNGEYSVTFSPMDYVKKLIPDPELTDIKPVKYLTRNKVKDQFYREKINDLDPRVISGQSNANVDINGEWLPKPVPQSPYFNKEYHALKTGTDEKSTKLYSMLNVMKREYLQRQVKSQEEGERLDLVVPARNLDHLESKKMFITHAGEAVKYVRNSLPFASANKGIEAENVNYGEEIGALTVQPHDIYRGALSMERGIRLMSARRIPLNRQSKDVTSSIASYMEEVNVFDAKNQVSPVVKSFADVFENANDVNPKANKWRARTLRQFEKTKIYNEAPDNIANHPVIARLQHILTAVTTRKLLGDVPGAAVSFFSGTTQQQIQAAMSPEAWRSYLSSGWEAKNWLYNYDKDMWNKASWSKETQIVSTFNFLPERAHISHQLSTGALGANFHAILMTPRAQAERYMAIHIGLSVLQSHKVDFQGTIYKVQDLYHTDPTTGLLELKSKFQSLDDRWNPINGYMVKYIRGVIIQTYTQLQGNFFEHLQSYSSNFALGKLAEVMKRWVFSGIIRRYSNETIDPFTDDVRKGYHTAMVNLMGEFFKSLFSGDMDRLTDYWRNLVEKRPSEKYALQRSLSEMMYTLIAGLTTMFVLGYNSNDKDSSKKLKEMNRWKQFLVLVGVRYEGELGTFIPLPVFGLGYTEMRRNLLDPFGIVTSSGVNNIAALGALATMQAMYALGDKQFENRLYYQKDSGYWYRDKGHSKLLATLFNTLGYTNYTFQPTTYIKTVNNMQNRLK